MKARTSYLIFLLYVCLALTNCATGEPFQMIQSPDQGRGLIYLVRPAVSTWAWRVFQVNLYRYHGHFTEDNDPELMASIAVRNNDFRRLYLQPGYYRLELKGHSSRILNIKDGELAFYEVYMFSQGFFHFPELDIREITGKQALEALAGSHPMVEHEAPIYCCKKGSSSEP